MDKIRSCKESGAMIQYKYMKNILNNLNAQGGTGIFLFDWKDFGMRSESGGPIEFGPSDGAGWVGLVFAGGWDTV